MTCDQLLAYLSEYLDNTLEAELIAEAQTHLRTCQHCRVILNTTQQVIILGHGQPPRVIPAHLRTRLMTQLREAFLEQSPSEP